MALGDVYVEVDDLKNRLDINDVDDETRLDGAVWAASRGIEKFCRRQFNDAGSATARVYRATSECLVKVDDFHTTTGLVVKVDTDGDGVYETTLTTTDYECEPYNGIVDGEPGWPYWTIRAVRYQHFPLLGRAGVQVTARWGWAAVPTPVTEACRVAAEELFKLRDTPFGIGGYGDFGIVRARDNPFVARMCSPYQRASLMVA
jgi:hypothetical protein